MNADTKGWIGLILTIFCLFVIGMGFIFWDIEPFNVEVLGGIYLILSIIIGIPFFLVWIEDIREDYWIRTGRKSWF